MRGSKAADAPAERRGAPRWGPRRLRRLGGAVLGAALLGACGGSEAPPPGSPAGPIPPCRALERRAPPEPRSIVLIVADTLRRDRLGAYGGPASTPAFDRFARENLLATDAHAPSPWTKPAMATLFTGLHPSRHGVQSHPPLREEKEGEEVVHADVLADRHATLAERFHEAGYATAAFVSNPWMGRRFGFAQGFERYEDAFAATDTPGTRVSEAGLRWLAEHDDERPFLLYLHYMDPHAPYHAVDRASLAERRAAIRSDERPVGRGARRIIRRVAHFPDGSPVAVDGLPANRALFELVYDQGVEAFDRALGAFLEGFEARPGSEEVAVVVTSDHGEALFEHGWYTHGFGLFDEEIAIPFAARLPGVAAPGGLHCPTGLADLLPTLARYLDLPAGEEAMDGQSLLAPARGADARTPRYVVAEGVKRKPRHRAVRSGGYKLLYEPAGRPGAKERARDYALFAVQEGREQGPDLLGPERRDAEVQRAFEHLAEALREAAPAPGAGAEPERAPLDEATRRRLEALGYLEE